MRFLGSPALAFAGAGLLAPLALAQTKSLPENPQFAALPGRTVSASRQFIVRSSDRDFRQRIASIAEDTKRTLLQTLRLDDGWRLPILIVVRDASAGTVGDPPPGRLRLVDTEGVLKVQLDLERRPLAGPDRFESDLARAVFFEMAARDTARAGGAEVVLLPPVWLVEGTLALAEMRRGHIPSYLYETLLKSGQTNPLDLLRGEPAPPRSAEAALQRAVGAALVQSLLDRPEGARGLVDLLRAGADAPGSDPLERIFAGFPSLEKSPAALARGWSVQAGRFAAQKMAGVMDPRSTRAAIEAALRFESGKGPERRVCGLEGFESLPRGRERSLQARRAIAALETLAPRVHPLWGAVLQAHLGTLHELARGRTRDLPERIRLAEELDAAAAARADAIDDHLNWMEANAPGLRSSTFDSYLRAAVAPEGAGASGDAIARYLDSIEREFRQDRPAAVLSPAPRGKDGS